MIKVNWQNIKPFEKKNFAVPAMGILILLMIIPLIIAAFSNLVFMPLKLLTAVLIFLTVAFCVHIESRMLQIYMLMGVLDVGLFCAALIPVLPGVTTAFFVISVIACAVSAALCISSNFIKEDTEYKFKEPDRSNVFAGKNVMLFAPHEDDEINVFGGIIEQYVKYGSTVRVVFSTNGDFHKIGKTRIREALKVAKRYSIPEKNFIFLGYSDSIENESGLNIYNCAPDEKLTSHAGYSTTYGSKLKKPYRNHAFTRNNMLLDIKGVILDYRPDTLFCCDYDSHADHRALALLFDEAVGSILKENPFYRPSVYKGFAYSTAWDGKKDYYSLNAPSTHLKTPSDYMTETNIFNWCDRVRFPVAAESLSHLMQNSSSYMAMMEYSSQTATDHANGIINSDKIFWRRRTDSVLYDAQIQATSGDPSHLNEFKLVHSNDIKKQNELPLDGVWTADRDDTDRVIYIKLPTERKISSLVLYENPSAESHITDTAIILGNVRYSTGELKPNGAATIFEFPAVSVSVIGIKIKSFEGSCSLSRIEAFENHEDDKLQFIKLCNHNDDFCYDYITDPLGKEAFYVYTYPHLEKEEFDVVSDNEYVVCEQNEGKITVFCPEGESANIKITSAGNPDICDCVRISNPDERDRNIIKFKQKYEQLIFSPAMQWDYYRGLVRRLGTYFRFLNR